MAGTNILQPPIDAVVEVETVTFDYGLIIDSDDGVTITGVITLTALVSTLSTVGDATPQSRIIGAPQIVKSPATGANAAAVSVLFGTAVAGVTYLLQCVATTSDGQTLSSWTTWYSQAPG